MRSDVLGFGASRMPVVPFEDVRGRQRPEQEFPHLLHRLLSLLALEFPGGELDKASSQGLRLELLPSHPRKSRPI